MRPTDTSDDDAIRPLWRRLLVNRFVLTPLIIALVAAGWDLYARTHAHGIVMGSVVDAAGRPVAGADVTLWTFNFTTFSEASHIATGADGRFAFTGNPSHNIQVSAAKAGVGASSRVPIRLYFRGQDTALNHPLVLGGG